jgi:hypothetical protein
VFTPTAAGTAVITATSTQDTTKSGTASVAVGSATTNNEWVWMGGSSTVDAPGVYGSLGVAAATNVPGARDSAASSIDQRGNFWLFGGYGIASSKTYYGIHNDLWEFNPTTEEWTWVSGSNALDVPGVYGTQGVAATTNFPGARYGSVSWIDNSGNFWLFGGSLVDPSDSLPENANDLWEFNPTTAEWTWISGSNTYNAVSVYGTQGVAASTNVPGATFGSASWTDKSGNLWLFGAGSTSDLGAYSNDLWEFNITTKMWTWENGTGRNYPGVQGIYGTLGVAASTNVPGARLDLVSWTDQSGNFWIFGGSGYAASGTGNLNDLWMYNPTVNEWTWESGSNTVNAPGVYGTLGVAAANNVPGARYGSVSWTDSSGNLWLFGGNIPSGSSNDLWSFSPSTDEWTWMGGSQTGTAAGTYGTLGVVNASNVPGGRMNAVSWIDSGGRLWLFGGLGWDSLGAEGDLNDLWRYQP